MSPEQEQESKRDICKADPNTCKYVAPPPPKRDWPDFVIKILGLILSACIPVAIWWATTSISAQNSAAQAEISRRNRAEDTQLKIVEIVWNDLNGTKDSTRKATALRFLTEIKTKIDSSGDTIQQQGPLYTAYDAVLKTIYNDTTQPVSVKHYAGNALLEDRKLTDKKSLKRNDTTSVAPSNQTLLAPANDTKISGPGIVYIQYSDTACKDKAETMAGKLRSNYFVPNIYYKPDYGSNGTSAIKYFNISDTTMVQKVKSIVKNYYAGDVQEYYDKNSAVKQGQIEVWLNNQFCVAGEWGLGTRFVTTKGYDFVPALSLDISTLDVDIRAQRAHIQVTSANNSGKILFENKQLSTEQNIAFTCLDYRCTFTIKRIAKSPSGLYNAVYYDLKWVK